MRQIATAWSNTARSKPPRWRASACNENAVYQAKATSAKPHRAAIDDAVDTRHPLVVRRPGPRPARCCSPRHPPEPGSTNGEQRTHESEVDLLDRRHDYATRRRRDRRHARHRDHHAAGSTGRRSAARRILERYAIGRVDAEHGGRRQIRLRVRLVARHLVAGDDHVERQRRRHLRALRRSRPGRTTTPARAGCLRRRFRRSARARPAAGVVCRELLRHAHEQQVGDFFWLLRGRRPLGDERRRDRRRTADEMA